MGIGIIMVPAVGLIEIIAVGKAFGMSVNLSSLSLVCTVEMSCQKIKNMSVVCYLGNNVMLFNRIIGIVFTM